MKHQIDLHIHSKYSDDGEYEPEELVEMCHQKGIKVMAIADHNQVKAIKAARKKAEEYGIRYISAIEIDCTYKDINFFVAWIDYFCIAWFSFGVEIPIEVYIWIVASVSAFSVWF